MNLTVRPAEEADADFLVWAMMTAATSHLDRCVWSTLCGFDERATADLLRRVLRRGPAHWCHLERFLVVESEGDAIAAASSFEPATQGTEVLTEAVLGVLGDVGMDEESVAAMLHRSEVLDAVTPKPRPSDATA